MSASSIGGLLQQARRRLAVAGCEQPGLDARLLLQAAAGLTHTEIAASPEQVIDGTALEVFDSYIARREGREPVSRIIGSREFYGRSFAVTPAVLDPRADTETLIGAALEVLKPGDLILDLGTGSGAIILTLLAERPGTSGVATDQSAAALDVARANAVELGVAERVVFVEGDWFEPVAGAFDIIVSNPPYIRDGDIAGLAPDVRNFDPWAALAGGADGLDAYRRIAEGAPAHLAAGGLILLEIGAGQADGVAAIFGRNGFERDAAVKDLGGHVRCLSFVPRAAACGHSGN